MGIKKVALYARVSTDRQAKDGDSIPAQLEALRSFVADRKDMVIAGEFVDDGISGTKFSERDELQRLLTAVERGQIDVILFTKLDRWFRSVKHYIRTQEVLDRHDVGWKAIWESVYDTTTPTGRLMVSQMLAFAQFEAENTGQRIRSVFDYKVSKGEAITGNVPFGYKIKNKHLVPSEDADKVRMIFKHYAMTGNLHNTTRMSAACGCSTSLHGVKYMLQNKKYIGILRNNTSYCEPIVDKALFDDVQRKLAMNIKVNQKHTYIFSGLIRCAECGASMGANRRMRKRGNCTTVEVGYRCPVHYMRGDRRCPNTKMLNENALERFLLKNIKPLMQEHITDYEISQKPSVDAEKRRATVEGKINRLKTLYVDGLISIDEYKADRKRLEDELSNIPLAQPGKDLSELKELLSLNLEEIYATFSKEEKRFFWRGVVKEIHYGLDKKIEVFFC